MSEVEVLLVPRNDGWTGARGVRPRAFLFRSWAMACWFVSTIAFLGCQRGGDIGTSQQNVPSSGNHPPSIRAASLLPSPLVLNGPVSVTIDAQDLDRNPLSFRYQWRINGQVAPHEQSEQLRPELLKRGDQVEVEVWPHDGTIEGASFKTPTVLVGNSPPVVSRLSVEPNAVSLGMRIRALAEVHDADHDLVHVTYRWWKNDKLVQEGEEAELDTAHFATGDALSVEVVASDSAGAGQPVRSAVVKIGNTPPRIVSIPPTSLDQNQFVYQVEASDAESDVLTFSLESAPASMTIDQRKGLVIWKISPDQTGIHKVRILVTDSQGAASFQDFEINVAGSSPPDKA